MNNDEQKALRERQMQEAIEACERSNAAMTELHARARAVVKELTALAKIEEGT